MTPKCFHSLENGNRCTAPAIHGSKFCRHHDPQRPKQVEAEIRDTEPLDLPPLLDKPSMLVALDQVARALAAGRIKRSVAQTLLTAIKLADRLVTEITEAGATGVPARLSARQSNDWQSLMELDELDGIMQQIGPKKGAPQSKSSATAPAGRQEIISLAASGGTQKPVQAFSLCDQATDRFVEEMMAQAHELLAGGSRPDPAFLRA